MADVWVGSTEAELIDAQLEIEYRNGFKAGQENMRERAAAITDNRILYGVSERIRALPLIEPPQEKK